MKGPYLCAGLSSSAGRLASSASGLAYKHQKPIKDMEKAQLVEKVKELETMAHALTRKVLSLEGELTEMRKNK